MNSSSSFEVSIETLNATFSEYDITENELSINEPTCSVFSASSQKSN